MRIMVASSILGQETNERLLKLGKSVGHKSWDADQHQVLQGLYELSEPTLVTGPANLMGSLSLPGIIHDFSGLDPEDDMPWDFNIDAKRNRALNLVYRQRALLVIGSPLCALGADWLASWDAMSDKAKSQACHKVDCQVQFLARLYSLQAELGGYYVHEHPTAADTWLHPEIQELKDTENTYYVQLSKLAFAWPNCNGEREFHSTGFMTNSKRMADRLERLQAMSGSVCLLESKTTRGEGLSGETSWRIVLGLLSQLKCDGRLSSQGSLGIVSQMDYCDSLS